MKVKYFVSLLLWLTVNSLFAQDSNIRCFMLKDGSNVFIPEDMIIARTDDGEILNLQLKGDTVFSIHDDVLMSEELNPEIATPDIKSFKFNNKFNDQLFTDAEGEIVGDSIFVTVGCIGKRLTPSFKLTDGSAYIGTKKQISKQSSVRFDNVVEYVIAYPNQYIYQKNSDGSYGFGPYGHKYYVDVIFLTDITTAEYSVPTVYIDTENGYSITSKTTYVNASISIDGAGVYPDLEKTYMQIKGRGNSTWKYSKKPYRIKFDEKQSPFGMTGRKSWVLLSQPLSGSMLCNPIGMKIAALVETKGYNHMIPFELYLNGEYRGSYVFTEKVGFHNNSIDLDDESNAAMLELDDWYDGLYKFKDESFNVCTNIIEPDWNDTSTQTNLNYMMVKNSFNSFMAGLKGNTDTFYNTKIDVESFVRFMLVNDLMYNSELVNPKSTYVYNENVTADSVWVFGPVWDLDFVAGWYNHGCYFAESPSLDYISNMSYEGAGKKFFKALLKGSDIVKKQYYRLWTEFYKGDKFNELLEYITDYYNYAKLSFNHNYELWKDYNNYKSSVANGRNWLKRRAAYIYGSLKKFDISDEVNLPEEDDYGQPNDIHTIRELLPSNLKVYTINGILVKENVNYLNATEGLPSGLYIIGSEKVYVK